MNAPTFTQATDVDYFLTNVESKIVTRFLWHRLTGGLRRRWANQALNSFTVDALAASRRVALEAFRTAISYRFFRWLEENQNLFAAYKASLGFIWA